MARLRKGQSRKLTKREQELFGPDLRAFFAARNQYGEAIQRLSRMVAAIDTSPDVQFNPDTLELSRPPSTPTARQQSQPADRQPRKKRRRK
jgi:hypothetical protein